MHLCTTVTDGHLKEKLFWVMRDDFFFDNTRNVACSKAQTCQEKKLEVTKTKESSRKMKAQTTQIPTFGRSMLNVASKGTLQRWFNEFSFCLRTCTRNHNTFGTTRKKVQSLEIKFPTTHLKAQNKPKVFIEHRSNQSHHRNLGLFSGSIMMRPFSSDSSTRRKKRAREITTNTFVTKNTDGKNSKRNQKNYHHGPPHRSSTSITNKRTNDE